MIRGFAGLIAVSVLLLSAPPPEAQPNVMGVIGPVADDWTIVIYGTHFGTKAAAKPLVWEDLSDGVLNPKLVNHGSGPAVVNGDNLRHPFSTRNLRTDHKTDNAYFGYDAGTARKWFVQYWIKLASNWHWGTTTPPSTAEDVDDDGLANVKFFRMFPTGSRTYANAGYSLHGFRGGQLLRFVENGEQNYLDTYAPTLFTAGVWHSVQVEYGENSAAGMADGTMRLWVDGVLKDSTTTLDTNPIADGEAVDKRPYVIGLYDSWRPSDAPVDNMYAYYTDFYVDNSWSRVELGNAPTYAASTHREMLIPSIWTPNVITARVTQGTFKVGDRAYVYVTDASGRVNATGHRVTVPAIGRNPWPQRN